MTDLQIGAKVDLSQALVMLDKEAVLAADLSLPFRGPIDQMITRFFERQFATRGAAGGEAWPKDSALTQRLRSRSGHGHEGATAILRDVNVLWSSYVKSGGPDSIRVIEPQHYIRGSAVPYAWRHQEASLVTSLFGRPLRTPKTRPARKVVPDELPQDVMLGIENAIADHVDPRNVT